MFKFAILHKIMYNTNVSILDADFQMQIKNLFKEDTLMKTTAEMKIEISNARISNATIMPDGTCKLELEVKMATKEQENNENVNDVCILVEASKLSLKDDFMSHKPKTEAEKKFKAILTKVIKTGIEDFYRPTMDPSFSNKKKTKIHYVAGLRPAVGKSYNWWEETVKDSKWCLGTKEQYVAFLGVLIKMLVDKGWTIAEAWDAICNDSKKLGHYYNSNDTKHQFEDTGSRETCGFFDLANTYKMLAEDKEKGGFWLVGGSYYDSGCDYPLASLLIDNDFGIREYGVAWLVLKK